MADFRVVTVDAGNVDEWGFFCIKNKKHPGYIAKRAWLQRRFEEGLRIKLIVTADGSRAGFVEYVPAEHTWRVMHAPGYLVIHCLWVNSNKFPYSGMASTLLEACTREAELQGKAGVAVVASDGPWMAAKDVYLKNGWEPVDAAEPHFQLLVRRTGEGPLPAFPQNWSARLRPYDGLHLLYTNQCPFIGKAVKELPPVAEQHGIPLHLVEWNDPVEAREKMPSPYGVISLVYQRRLLVDHPISATRFRNILQKAVKR